MGSGTFSFFIYTICIGCPPLADGVIQLKKNPTDDIRKQIGWRIQEKRIEKGITAVDLSTYLNITANQVSRIERGCAGIDIYKLIVICKILGVSADYILFGEMKEENITISKEQFEAINGLISMFGKEKL